MGHIRFALAASRISGRLLADYLPTTVISHGRQNLQPALATTRSVAKQYAAGKKPLLSLKDSWPLPVSKRRETM